MTPASPCSGCFPHPPSEIILCWTPCLPLNDPLDHLRTDSHAQSCWLLSQPFCFEGRFPAGSRQGRQKWGTAMARTKCCCSGWDGAIWPIHLSPTARTWAPARKITGGKGIARSFKKDVLLSEFCSPLYLLFTPLISGSCLRGLLPYSQLEMRNQKKNPC